MSNQPIKSGTRQLGQTPSRWSDLRLRILSAAVLVPIALLSVWTGGTAFAGLVAVITVGLSHEWLALCRQPVLSWPALAFAALPLAVLLTAAGQPALALTLLAAAACGGIALAGGCSPSRPLAFGIPYLGAAALALVWLRQPTQGGGANVIILLLIIWASDIGAYVVGRVVGGPRLAPTISPGKTWSGAVGGLFAAAATGLLASVFLANGPASWRSLAVACLLGVIAQGGDLFESQLKRHFGVKDSGNMIPGHGGLLDRLDAVLTAAPAAALLALGLGRGVIL